MEKENNNIMKIEIEVWEYAFDSVTSEKKLIYHNKNSCERKVERKVMDDIKSHDKNKKNIGIGLINSMYIEVNDIQDKEYELKKIMKFINKYMEKYTINRYIDSYNENKLETNIKDYNVEFINYGKTELVYVLTEVNGNQLTLLIKQPAVELGKVKEEADNLIELQKKDKSIVAPIDYFRYGDQELYVTPYINQARCIASDSSWGMYIPEPYYRFEPFTREQERIVNTCMIAKLVSLYDFEKQEGISSCKLGGGDFMLPKGWELEEPTIENTLDSLYLIAAREKTNCSFDNYLEIIRKEFSKRTIDEVLSNLIINIRGRVPMLPEDIEAGIELGQGIIKNSNFNNNIKKVRSKK